MMAIKYISDNNRIKVEGGWWQWNRHAMEVQAL
jgi:hypothetical protein